MKWKLRFVAVLFFCLSPFSYADQGHVGEIRYSILTPAQFSEIYGPEWELMKGQAIPADSELLPLWGRSSVPDARGLFLRCDNGPRRGRRADGFQNPESLRVGDYQLDEFRKHDHKSEKHSHGHNLHLGTCHGIGGGGVARGGGFNWMTEGVSGGISDARVEIKPRGGKETRPKCLIVNAFIKMREAAPAAPLNPFTSEVMNRMVHSPEFRAAVENVFQDMMNRNHL